MKCCFTKHNMSERDMNIRVFLSFIFIIYSFFSGALPFLVMGFMLLLTVVKKSCFIYRIFKINEDVSLKNEYLEALPKYNPEPVFILNKNAKIIFKNEPAEELFLNVEKFDFLYKNHDLDEIISTNTNFQVQHTFKGNKTFLFSLVGAKEMNSIMAYASNITETIQANEEIINIQKEIVYTIGAVGETRSKETGNHVKRVALYSEILGQKYGLSQKEIELLKLASPMHDIGKVGIKDKILNKPGKLTSDEFIIMKTHAKIGYDMLKNSKKEILQTAAIVAYEHHEKFDGSGYPRALKGEDIHIYGRITAIADVFDALGSTRVYKRAWELDEIFELFRNQSGLHFDPKLIDLFFEHYDEFDKVRVKYKDI